MGKCVYCGDETELLQVGIPVCLKCANSPERRVKHKQVRDLKDARAQNRGQQEEMIIRAYAVGERRC